MAVALPLFFATPYLILMAARVIPRRLIFRAQVTARSPVYRPYLPGPGGSRDPQGRVHGDGWHRVRLMGPAPARGASFLDQQSGTDFSGAVGAAA